MPPAPQPAQNTTRVSKLAKMFEPNQAKSATGLKNLVPTLRKIFEPQKDNQKKPPKKPLFQKQMPKTPADIPPTIAKPATTCKVEKAIKKFGVGFPPKPSIWGPHGIPSATQSKAASSTQVGAKNTAALPVLQNTGQKRRRPSSEEGEEEGRKESGKGKNEWKGGGGERQTRVRRELVLGRKERSPEVPKRDVKVKRLKQEVSAARTRLQVTPSMFMNENLHQIPSQKATSGSLDPKI